MWAAHVYFDFCSGLTAQAFAYVAHVGLGGDAVAVHSKDDVACTEACAAGRRVPLRLADDDYVASFGDIRSDAGVFTLGDRKNLVLIVGWIIFGIRVDLVEKRIDSLIHYSHCIEGVDVVGLQLFYDGIECVELAGELVFLGCLRARCGDGGANAECDE